MTTTVTYLGPSAQTSGTPSVFNTIDFTIPAGTQKIITTHILDDSGSGYDFAGARYDVLGDDLDMGAAVFDSDDDGVTAHRPTSLYVYDVTGRTLPEDVRISADLDGTDQHSFQAIAISSDTGVADIRSILAANFQGGAITDAQSASVTIASQPTDKIVASFGVNSVLNEVNVLKQSSQTILGTAVNASCYHNLYSQTPGGAAETTVTFGQDASVGAQEYGLLAMAIYETAAAIEATHGDADVAYGEDPGFTGNVNGANLTDGTVSVALALGASSTNSAPTFDLEDFTTYLRDTPWVPFSGTQLQIEITSDDGGDTPVTRDITLALPANFAQVALSSVVNTIGSAFYQSSIYSGPDFTPEDGAQMVYDSLFATSVGTDGVLTTDRNGTEIKAWIYLPTPNLLIYSPFSAPPQIVITIDGSPATLEPSTQYTATVLNSTSVCDGGQTFNTGTGHDVTIDSADLNSITFTTNASLPAASAVEFKFNFPTA